MAEKAFEAFGKTTAFYDSPFYMNPVRIMAPYLKGVQVLFLWERGLEMIASNDGEMRWFGQIKLANLAPYLPETERRTRLYEIDPARFGNHLARIILLLERSTFAAGEEKVQTQEEVWELVKAHTGTSMTNSDSVRALAVNWPAASDDKGGNMTVLEYVVSRFDPETIWPVWRNTIAAFQKDTHSLSLPRRKFLHMTKALAEHMPARSADAACEELDSLKDEFLGVIWARDIQAQYTELFEILRSR